MKETIATALPYTAKAVRALRARAHALKPVVWISQNGLSEGALREIDRALTSHELIKIHAALDGRLEREALLGAICTQLGAQAVQIIGKMLVAFRQRNEAEPERRHAPASAKTPNRRANHSKKLAKPGLGTTGKGAMRPPPEARGNATGRPGRRTGKAGRDGDGQSRRAKHKLKRT